MFVMSESVKRIIEEKTGRSLGELKNLSLSEEIALIRERTGKMPTFSKRRNPKISGRGNPLLARKRIRTMEYVEKRLDEICKE